MTEPEGVPSPADWTAPPGSKPGWNWIPEGYELRPRLDAVPGWVRLWYRLPFVDRYAHVWMWRHGGWLVVPPLLPPPPPDTVRGRRSG